MWARKCGPEVPWLENECNDSNEVLAAVRTLPPSKNFVWNGVDEDDRPATVEELQAGVAFTRLQKAKSPDELTEAVTPTRNPQSTCRQV